MAQRLFGTAGIRGVTNVGITAELALRVARAYGDYIVKNVKKHGSVAVGHDTRWGAEMLARAAASGFASAGLHVQFYGCVSTGVFSLNVARTEQDGGLLVTGSHMPPDRIGLLLVEGDGAIAPFSVTDKVEAILESDDYREVPPQQIGRLEEAFHPYEQYVSECMQALDAPLCRQKHYKVLADPANGTASYIAMEFFQWLGCKTELINYDPSPVPGRPSEPRAATVTEAIEVVRREKCDLGACFDVDADRVLFIDGDGIPVSEDTVGAVFAKSLLKPGDICVVPINSSGLIERVCGDVGARLEYCAVGQPPTLEAIKRLGAAYSYEESGKYYFPRTFLWPDGVYSAGRMLELMAKSGRTLAELASEFPKYHQVKRNVSVESEQQDQAMRRAAQRLEKALVDGRTRDITVDGFKRVYADHSWLLFRKSGTEPLIRVYSDAPTKERAEELAQKGEELLQQCL
ncbi:MAG TPA: phosphoglucomutase [Planctomycetota bacterium]|nr:phosphoglucomutase [Planctomycetota bacterium]